MDEYEQDLRVLEEKHQQGLYSCNPLHPKSAIWRTKS